MGGEKKKKKRGVNPPTCGVQSVIQFLNTKNVHSAEIHRHTVEEYGEVHCMKGMWGNGVSCAMNARLMCAMRNEVGAHLWSWMT